MATRDVEALSGSGESGSEDQATSRLLVVPQPLKASKPFDLSRKRKIAVNLPCGKHSCKSTNVVTAVVALATC